MRIDSDIFLPANFTDPLVFGLRFNTREFTYQIHNRAVTPKMLTGEILLTAHLKPFRRFV